MHYVIPPIPIPSQWYNGTGWTHGIGHTSWYMMGHPIRSHPFPMVQRDGMDTWDWAHCMVHCGTSHSVPSPPNGTMGWDGHMGLGTPHGISHWYPQTWYIKGLPKSQWTVVGNAGQPSTRGRQCLGLCNIALPVCMSGVVVVPIEVHSVSQDSHFIN